jgi:hypothetical protein
LNNASSGATAGRAGFTGFAAGRDGAADRAVARDLAFAGLVDLVRAALTFDFRAAGFAVLRAAEVLRAACLVAGFLFLEVFLPGIVTPQLVASSGGL